MRHKVPASKQLAWDGGPPEAGRRRGDCRLAIDYARGGAGRVNGAKDGENGDHGAGPRDLFENDPRWQAVKRVGDPLGARTGVVPSQGIHALIGRKEIFAADDIVDPRQVQPASLDLRLDSIAAISGSTHKRALLAPCQRTSLVCASRTG